MAIRTADAEWRGTLAQGAGHMRLGSGAFDGPYDFRSRMGDGKGTNPEELLGAAHAGCYSMALALQLANAGLAVDRIHTTAKVHFEEREGDWSIQRIDLNTEAWLSDVVISDATVATFAEQAQIAKKNCPVSRALSGVDIHLSAKVARAAA